MKGETCYANYKQSLEKWVARYAKNPTQESRLTTFLVFQAIVRECNSQADSTELWVCFDNLVKEVVDSMVKNKAI